MPTLELRPGSRIRPRRNALRKVPARLFRLLRIRPKIENRRLSAKR